MESLEGKRGIPRIRPPFPAVVGLWGGPTVINNAETLASVPHIILGGAEWYANLGPPKNGGTRLFCLSGHVKRPGVYELPMGYNLRKMIFEVGGGIPNGRALKAVVPGGSSTPVLKSDEIDIAMDFDSVAKAGSMLGSGGVVVLDDTTCIVKFALRTMKFYQHESCGWCIPCREGYGLAEEDADSLSLRRRSEKRYRQHVLPVGKHAGPDVLPAGRRRGDADHGVHQEIPAGV